MSQLRQSTVYRSPYPALLQDSEAAALHSIVYRSRAAAPLSGYELYELVRAAQSNNQAQAISGLMLYDDCRFYQWLEGPAPSVRRVMRAISEDRRHTDIEILSDKPVAARQFGDWSMRLATRGVRSIRSKQDVLVPSKEVLDELLRRPDRVPYILEALSPAKILSNGPLQGDAGALLKEVILSAVLPELVARHVVQGKVRPWPVDASARALADLLLAHDSDAVIELLRTLQGGDASVRRLYKTTIEPAARHLGDLWTSDTCSEFEVTFALSGLQHAIRVLNEDAAPIVLANAFLPAVLIVPEPGEIHSLTAVLDSDALWNAGWDTQSEYPATDEALQDLIAGSWFDALDLSLSTAFRREHWLPRVTKTIELARHASRNPALVVVVGGRLFAEDDKAGAQAGADATSATSMQAEQAIRQGLRKLTQK